MEKSLWKFVDTKRLNAPREEVVGDVHVTVYFGPDDMPAAVTGETDSEKGVIRIFFRYDSEGEARVRRVLGERRSILYGKKTKRIYGLELPSDSSQSRISANVVSTLNRIQETSREIGLERVENYLAAKQAYEQVSPQVESLLRSYYDRGVARPTVTGEPGGSIDSRSD